MDKGLSGKTIGLGGIMIGSVVANDRPATPAAGENFLCGDGAGGLVVKNSEGTKTLLNSADALAMTDTTDSSSSTTGALKTAGGLGVAKKVFVGTGVFTPKFKDATDASGVAATATTLQLLASGTQVANFGAGTVGFYSGTTPVAQFSDWKPASARSTTIWTAWNRRGSTL